MNIKNMFDYLAGLYFLNTEKNIMESILKIKGKKMSISFEYKIKTSGNGLWSNESRSVLLKKISVSVTEGNIGEMDVFFDTNTWNIKKHGLIYTDGDTENKGFKPELKKLLKDIGLNVDEIEYSEQSMQGDDYVNFDVGEDFIKSWKELGFDFDYIKNI